MILVFIDQAIDYCKPPIPTPRTFKEARDIVNEWDGSRYHRMVVEIREVPNHYKPSAKWGQGVFKTELDGTLTLIAENYDTSG